MRKLFTLSALLIGISAYSQINVTWSKNYGGNSYDYLFSGIYGREGRYAFAGTTQSNTNDILVNHGGTDAWILILNENGTKHYSKTLNGQNFDYLRKISQRSDSTYVLLVNSNSNCSNCDFTVNNGGNDFWLKFLTHDTILINGINYGGNSDDQANDMCITSAGNYLVCGQTFSNNSYYTENNNMGNGFLMRIAQNGSVIWSHIYGTNGAFYTDLRKVIELSNGNIITAGNYGSKPYLVKINSIGTFIEHKYLEGNNTEQVTALTSINDTIYLGGFGNSTSYQFTTHTNTDNSTAFIYKVHPTTLDYIDGLFITGNNFEALGDIIPFQDSLLLVSIMSSSDTGIFQGNKGGADLYVAIINKDFKIKGIYPFGGTGDDGTDFEFPFISSFYNHLNEVVITSGSTSSNGNLPANYGGVDAWILRFNPSQLLTGNKNSSSDYDVVIYPNPAKNNLNILLPFSNTETTINIIDFQGRVIKSMTTNLNINNLDISDLPNGSYIINLSNNEYNGNQILIVNN